MKNQEQWQTELLYCELATWPQHWPTIAANFNYDRAALADYLLMQTRASWRDNVPQFASLRRVYLEFRDALPDEDLNRHISGAEFSGVDQ